MWNLLTEVRVWILYHSGRKIRISRIMLRRAQRRIRHGTALTIDKTNRGLRRVRVSLRRIARWTRRERAAIHRWIAKKDFGQYWMLLVILVPALAVSFVVTRKVFTLPGLIGQMMSSGWESVRGFFDILPSPTTQGIGLPSLPSMQEIDWNIMWAFWALITFFTLSLVFRKMATKPLRSLLLLSALGILAFVYWDRLGRPESVSSTIEAIRAPTEGTSDPLIVAAMLPLIARCESNGRQFEPDGVTPLRNTRGVDAIGMYQIRISVWGADAERLGYDLETLEGNEAMARWILENYGPGPWLTDPVSRTRADCAPFFAMLGDGATSEPGVVARAPLPDTILITRNAGEEWSEPVFVTDEIRGRRMNVVLLDSRGSDDCYQVRFSQGTFDNCPGQRLIVPGKTSFVQLRKPDAEGSTREFAIRFYK